MQGKEADSMSTLQEEAADAISNMPKDSGLDDIIYRLYVIDKVHKGREEVRNGQTISSDEMKKEMSKW